MRLLLVGSTLCDKADKSTEGDRERAVLEQQPQSKLLKLLIDGQKGDLVVRIGGQLLEAPNLCHERVLARTRRKELLR